jgi:hypothetical protein
MAKRFKASETVQFEDTGEIIFSDKYYYRKYNVYEKSKFGFTTISGDFINIESLSMEQQVLCQIAYDLITFLSLTLPREKNLIEIKN